MTKVILCVDDERTLLSALQQQLFRAFSHEYLLEFAESGKEALELIQEFKSLDTEVACIITDQMMPEMKGNELIQKVKDLNPSIPCILLTGYAENIKEFVDSKVIDECIFKPWDDTNLISLINKHLSI